MLMTGKDKNLPNFRADKRTKALSDSNTAILSVARDVNDYRDKLLHPIIENIEGIYNNGYGTLLRDYVQSELFCDKAVPCRTDNAYYPCNQDIRSEDPAGNHVEEGRHPHCAAR